MKWTWSVQINIQKHRLNLKLPVLQFHSWEWLFGRGKCGSCGQACFGNCCCICTYFTVQEQGYHLFSWSELRDLKENHALKQIKANKQSDTQLKSLNPSPQIKQMKESSAVPCSQPIQNAHKWKFRVSGCPKRNKLHPQTEALLSLEHNSSLML